jgi:uncharacterized membrane protein YkgB
MRNRSVSDYTVIFSFEKQGLKILEMAVFWVFVPCSLVKFTDVSEVLPVSIIRAISLMMAAVSTSETSANIYQTTRHKNPEDSHLHTRRRENLKSQLKILLYYHYDRNNSNKQ